MKKLFVYGAFLLALSACKDDKTPATTTPTTTTPTTTTPTTTDQPTTPTTSGGWSSTDKETFIKTCTDAAAATMGQSKASDYCTCMEGKVENLYPNSADAGKLGQAEMTELAKECLQ